MKKEITIISFGVINFILVIILIYILTKPKPNATDDKIQQVWQKVDSLKKENETLRVERTIIKQEAKQLSHSLDSLSHIRPKSIKQTNNEISRLHSATTAGKLAIGDSILRARRK